MPNDYETGYGKPPKANQFQKGQSGNPKGRPKGSRNLATLLEEILSQKVKVKEGGRERFITKQEALMTQMVNKGVAGDSRSAKDVFWLFQTLERSTPPEDGSEAPDQEKSRAVLNRLLQRMQESQTSDTEVNG